MRVGGTERSTRFGACGFGAVDALLDILSREVAGHKGGQIAPQRATQVKVRVAQAGNLQQTREGGSRLRVRMIGEQG